MIYKFERKLKGANQVEATGEELTINNAGRKVQKFELSGRSEQEARKGYNLLNVPSNFEITSSQNNRTVPISLKANVTYTIQADEIDTDNTVASPNFLFRLKYNNADIKTVYVLLRTKKASFTVPSDIDTVMIYSGTNYNESSNTNTTFKNLMIYEGEEEKFYEQYGISPSPDFPSEIKNVTGEINKYYILNSGKITSNGITATYTGNTSEIILDGVATRDFSDGFEIKNILLKKGTYSVSVWGLNKINEEYDRFFVADTSNNNKVIVNYVQSYRTQKFTLEQDTNIKLSFIIKAGSTYSNTKVKIMINEGDIGLSYVPYNSFKIRQTGKNMLPDNRDDYNGSQYGYIKLLNNFENNNLVLSIEDNDKSIDMTGIFFGVTGNGKNWDYLGIWLLNNGKKVGNSISTNQYSFFSFYPNNQTTFDKIFKRYKIQAEISKGIVPTELEKYKSNSWIFPLEPGQKLYEGSYLAEDGIHNTRKQATLKPKVGQIGGATVNTETKNTSFLIYNNIFDNLKKGQPLRAPLCNKLQGTTSGNYKNFNNQIVQWWDTSADFCAAIQTDLVGTTNDSIASYINNNQFVLEYFLNEEEIIPYTPEQQEIYSQLQNLELFRGCNHITVESNVKPTIKLSYYDGELDMTDYKYNLQFKKHMQEM